MTVTLLPPHENLIAAVADRLRAEGKDYSRNWVVFPEKRPGYYLRQALAEREGSGFIPPRVDSIDSFVNGVYVQRLGRADRALDVLDATALLFRLHQAAPDRLGRDHFLSADHFFPLGVKLFNDLEELKAGDVRLETLTSLDHLAEQAVPKETLNRLQSLSFFYERFYAAVRDRGASTRSSRLRDVFELIRPELFPDIDRFLFAGFFSLTKTEAGLLKTMGTWDSFSLFVPEGKGVESLFETLGLDGRTLQGALPESQRTARRAEMEFIKCPDTHGQVFALNKTLEDKLADPSHLHERQVIVLPAAETLFPLFQQTLSGLDEKKDFNISLGYPLARTPVYSFFDNLLELVQSMDDGGRVYTPNYLRFVLHPYTKNLYFPGLAKRADLTRILIHAVEEELLRRRTKAFWSLEEIESDNGIRESIQELSRNVDQAPDVAAFLEHLRGIHGQAVAPFRALRNVGDFAEKLIQVLDFVYENSTARLHYFFHPYAEAFRGQLEALSRSLLRDLVFRDKSSYFHLFQRVMAEGAVPFYGTPLRGLQVLGFWETRGIPFEEVNILDMNEEVIPSYKRADSLLPVAARRALGLPTYQDYERRMEYYLDTLVAGAKRVRFFFVENADKERSRFIERFIWDKQKQDREPRSDAYLKTVQYKVALQTRRPEAVRKTEDVAEFLQGFTYSATALDMYLHCPLQFYYGYVLSLREREEITERLEKKDVGIMVHAALEEYFRPFLGRDLRPGDLDLERMGGIVERIFNNAFGADMRGGAYLLKLQALRHLLEFISDYQAPVLKELEGKRLPLRIHGLEQRMGMERKVEGRVFKLSGKVDRTETRGDELTILDYKTSPNEGSLGIDFNGLDLDDRSSWNRAVASLQLPLYTMLLARLHDKPSHDIHCRFVMLGKNRLGPQIEFSPYNEEDGDERAAQIRTMESLIDRLLLEVTDERVPFDPSPASDRTCGWCSYTGICGRL